MALVSYKYNFIFIKTTKTAGTSLEIDLSQRMGAEDIVTPIYPECADHKPRNFDRENGRLYNHIPARDLRAIVGTDFFDNAHKFCVERDPLDKCISYFHMLRNSPLHNEDGHYTKSWNEFVEDRRFPIDLEKYSENVEGKRVSLVDTILDYDSLDSSLPKFLAELGVQDFKLVSRAKSEYSSVRHISPICVQPQELQTITEAYSENQNFLMTCGFEPQKTPADD